MLGGRVGAVAAQERSDTTRTWGYYGKLRPLPGLELPAFLKAPWLVSWPHVPRPTDEVESLTRRWMQAAKDTLSRAEFLKRLGFADDKAGEATEYQGRFGLSPRTADLHFDGEIQVDVSTSRQRALHCTPLMLLSLYSGCRGSFSAPKVDNQVVLRSEGIFGQRFHVEMDVNTGRSYASNNIIRGYFQGLPDEVVQRIDAGSVVFRAPTSRYLTASIPSNNFGLSAELQYGPVALQAIVAKQKGSSAQTRQMTIGELTTQPQDRKVSDLDFESGRFFWVVDPKSIPGFPALDILALENVVVPDNSRPEEIQVYRYIAANQPGTAGATYDGITAIGVNAEGVQEQHTGAVRWKALQSGVDFWTDPSGLWLVLALPLDPNDYLAVSYRTKGGTQVGTMPTIDQPAQSDSVHLIAMPNRDPRHGTFLHAMRQVYRVGSDIVRSSLKVGIEVARSERPASGIGTYLSLLGLAIPTDPSVVDIDNRLFPRTRDPGASLVVKDQLLVFPNAQPFADPSRLSAAERNDSLYRTPEYLLTTQGPPAKFQFVLRYDARSSGDSRGFFLGEVRPESELITADGRRLVRGVDYSINYETGVVSFLKPDDIVPPGGRGTSIVARFEQQTLYAVAPTSITGMTATWAFGRIGTLSLVGLYQSEKSAFRRPPVGSEPKAGLLTGLTSNFNLDWPALTRTLSSLSHQSVGAPSSFSFAAELAFSRPDPNRFGEAYLEEFEDDGGSPIPLAESSWLPGSSPQRPDGLENLGFAGGFQLKDAVQLTWQNLIQYFGGFYEVKAQDIDSTIKLTDSRAQALETVLWTTFHADTAGGLVDNQSKSHWSQPHEGGKPRWRSMTTSLSNSGADLTRNEYLEFWMYQSGDQAIQNTAMRMVIDIGKVSEDAVSFAPTTFTVNDIDTLWSGRQAVGLGRLDTERTGLGTWNAVTDNIGILGDRPDSVFGPGGEIIRKPALCKSLQTDGVAAYPFGDLGSRCTNGNGVLNTEDLDGDGVLDALGSGDDVQRYIMDFRDPKYFVRDRAVIDQLGRTAKWTLYRVPLRNPDARIGQPDLRLTKHMRLTFITPPGAGGVDPTIRFGLAMMRLTGAPWVRRSDAPIVGLSGNTAEAHGTVLVGSVSTQNTELGYTSPPGLGNTQNEIDGGITQSPIQINERALRLTVRDLRGGERAEAYHRLPGNSQNLLAYRQLHVWMRGAGPGWDDHTLEAYIKVGSDASNFYLYHVPVSTTTWEPDVVVELERWRSLRAEIETRFQQGEAPSGAATCGGDPNAWIACDGPYFVQVRDPQINPPNLYAVQELATGIWRPGTTGPAISETELWIDDIRLSAPTSETGMASALSGHLVASDIAVVDVDWTRRDGQFRQLSETPSYRTNGAGRITTSLRLDRLLPTWGFEIPLFYSRDMASSSLQLISGSDIRGEALNGLRKPTSDASIWSVSLRRRRGYSTSTLARILLDPLQVNASGGSATAVTELSRSESSQLNAGINYLSVTARRGRPLGLGKLFGGLPRWLSESEAGRGLRGATIALLPNTLRLSSGISKSAGEYLSFKAPIERASDSILRPNSSLQFLWQNSAGLTWQPVGMVIASADWRSTRDLRDYPDSTSLGRLVAQSRQALLGQDIGVERDRSLTSALTLMPRINSWLRPQLSTNSNFFLSRSLTSRNPVRLVGDTAGGYILPQTLNNTRVTRLGLDFDPLMVARRIWGDSSLVATALSRLRPIQLSRTHISQSTFDLATFTPGVSYQLALGGLDKFLTRESDRAIGAGEQWSTDLQVELDLPAGVNLSTRYISSESDRYQRLLGSGFLKTNTEQVEWPSGDISWDVNNFDWGPFASLRLGANVLEKHSSNTSPISAGQVLRSTEKSQYLHPFVRAGFRNQMSVDLSTSRTRDASEISGSTTRRKVDQIDLTVNANIRLPRYFSKLRRSLSTTLQVQTRSSQTCLERVADSACVVYSDQGLLDFRGSMFATFGSIGIRAGGQFGWSLEDDRSLKRQMSRINMRIYATVPLTSLGF